MELAQLVDSVVGVAVLMCVALFLKALKDQRSAFQDMMSKQQKSFSDVIGKMTKALSDHTEADHEASQRLAEVIGENTAALNRTAAVLESHRGAA